MTATAPAPALLSPRLIGTTSYMQPAAVAQAPFVLAAPGGMPLSPRGRPGVITQPQLAVPGPHAAATPLYQGAGFPTVVAPSVVRPPFGKNLSANTLPKELDLSARRATDQAASSPALATVAGVAAAGGGGGVSAGTLLSPRDALPSSPRGQLTGSGTIGTLLRAHPVPAMQTVTVVPSGRAEVPPQAATVGAGFAQDAIRWTHQPRRNTPVRTTASPASPVKVMLRQSASGAARPSSSPPPQRQRLEERKRPSCHAELYEDAFERKKRLESMKENFTQVTEREEHMRQMQHEEELRMRRRFYRTKDKRSHMEREQDAMRKKKEKLEALEAEQRAREEKEIAQCTFKPSLVKKLTRDLGAGEQRPGGSAAQPRPPGSGRALSPQRLAMSATGTSDGDYMTRLKDLVARQQAASEGLRGLAAEDVRLRERLREQHSELYDSILREETQRVVALLQDAHESEGSSAQKELIRRVRGMVAQGGNLETAQKMIVDELVGQSQEEVQKRVLEAFLPMRFEAEGSLYSRRLAFVHELEAVEALVMALKGGTLCDEARVLGFEFGLAEQLRRQLSLARGPASAAGASMLSCAGPFGTGGQDSPRSMVSAGGFSAVYGPRPVTTVVHPLGHLSGSASGRITPRSSQGLAIPLHKIPSEHSFTVLSTAGVQVQPQVHGITTPRGLESFTPRGSPGVSVLTGPLVASADPSSPLRGGAASTAVSAAVSAAASVAVSAASPSAASPRPGIISPRVGVTPRAAEEHAFEQLGSPVRQFVAKAEAPAAVAAVPTAPAPAVLGVPLRIPGLTPSAVSAPLLPLPLAHTSPARPLSARSTASGAAVSARGASLSQAAYPSQGALTPVNVVREAAPLAAVPIITSQAPIQVQLPTTAPAPMTAL